MGNPIPWGEVNFLGDRLHMHLGHTLASDMHIRTFDRACSGTKSGWNRVAVIALHRQNKPCERYVTSCWYCS